MKDRAALDEVYRLVAQHGFTITADEPDRIYGASVMLSEDDIETFVSLYFPDFKLPQGKRHKMSPKYLLVDAHQRLSWQYHNRRQELWSVIKGPVGVAVNQADEEVEPHVLGVGEGIRIAQGMRHRLIGLAQTGVITEIWTHTDPAHPSDEADIVRLQDDYHRPRVPGSE